MDTLIKDNFKVDAFYDYNYNTFNMKPHKHYAIEIMYLLGGAAEIEIQSEKFSLKKGHLVVINSLVDHKLFVKARGHILNLEISPLSQNKEFLLTSLLPQKFRDDNFLTLSDNSSIDDCMKRILQELSKKTSDAYLVNLRVLELLRLVSQSYINESFDNPLITKAITFIDGNFSSNLTIEQIATFVNLNRSYLQRQFKEATNQTIIDYIANLRIEKAKKMMSATSLPIVDIAIDVGYNSRQSFFKAFKKITGMSPTEYYETQKQEIQLRYKQTPYNK
ncbi:MAG: AraC family transcriptional regulator [Clostridia bacterium]